MARYTIDRGRDGNDFVFASGEPIGVITHGRHGRVTTCTIEGRRTHGANGECRPGEQPAWLVKHARSAGLIGTRRLSAPRKRKSADKLRDQDQPEVLGYELDRESLTPARAVINTRAPGDYGRDPVPQPDGTYLYRMVPSGDVVTYDESERRLRKKPLSGLAGKPSPAAVKAIEAKMKKLQAQRDKLTAEYRKGMEKLWSGDVDLDAWAATKAKYEAEDEALDDALTVLDYQRSGTKPPKSVAARTRPELLHGARRRAPFAAGDAVTMSSIMSPIPPMQGRPWVTRETPLVVKRVEGTGARTNPYRIATVLRDGDPNMIFWFGPDDIVSSSGVGRLGAARVSDPEEIAWRRRFNADTPARELVAEMSRLREFEPRPMHKMFGTNGGTPEQRAVHAAKIRQWQRAMSYLRRLHKPALERDNAAFRAGNLGRCGRRRCRRR